MTIGGSPIPVTFNNERKLRFVGPSLSPGGVYDIVVTNPSGLSGTLRNGYVSRFSDVGAHILFDSDRQARGLRCDGGLRRRKLLPRDHRDAAADGRLRPEGQARHLLRAPALHGRFPGRSLHSNFAPWIEQFAAEGITGGCGGGNYCPSATVTRQQMAVFLLKGKYGSNFTPPPCTGAFDDVPCPSPFADWIEQLAAEGVTGGCQVNPRVLPRRARSPGARWRPFW